MPSDPSRVQLDAVMWPDGPWPDLREEWQHAERIGIGRGWLYDHLVLGGRPVFHDAWVTLTAAAATTARIGLGTMVTAPNFRHPVTTAKAALTLHDVAGGRFVLGLGAGGPGTDSDAIAEVGLPRARRTARFREFVTMTDQLLGEPRVHVEGEFFTARDVDLGGDPGRRPPLAVAGTGRAGMALAARHAGLWITQDVAQDPRVYAGTPHAEVARQVDLLDEACAAAGRDPDDLDRLVVLGYGGERPLDSVESLRDCVGRYAALGFGTVAVLWPRGDDAASRLAVLEAGLADRPGAGLSPGSAAAPR
ncbi:LLM class flavin-dependent oxidoreductase [Nocardioides sp. SYSU D00038]|uniref:LLM class flavin-dependent oxidoreductase n=1 Tax=Nocardioides sp. SYSU D00038 TaxID=2812554 RepID=UPI0019675908|nr:LLM class flavin-dependent oxidoreductase [Nocardioides sp. SYSU D00038]